MRAGLPWPEKHAMPLAFGRIDGESLEDGEERAGEYLMAVARQVSAAGIDPETALRKAAINLRDHVLRAEELAEDVPLAELNNRTELYADEYHMNLSGTDTFTGLLAQRLDDLSLKPGDGPCDT